MGMLVGTEGDGGLVGPEGPPGDGSSPVPFLLPLLFVSLPPSSS